MNSTWVCLAACVPQAECLPVTAAADLTQQLDATALQIAAVRTCSFEPATRVRWAACFTTQVADTRQCVALAPLGEGLFITDTHGGLLGLPIAPSEQGVQVCTPAGLLMKAAHMLCKVAAERAFFARRSLTETTASL